ncbi:MAG: site-specific integrase [Candidatus Parvarchaeota archaeon]|nr:site-specific integrase [Candidatus Jingweiarchaeum tengchongense]MCW1304566.1 site-specific integrase [Candidatus Jingweiarchaeum tengchongense]MCW1310238.1 site-specific integrase [Candidatus Jingweiarchaeum tengchongense]
MKSDPTKENKNKEKYKIFSAEWLLQFKEVQTWLKTVSDKSQKQYLHALRYFCEFCRKTPKQLILERDKEIRNSDPNSRTGIRDLILDFRKYLEREGYTLKSINCLDGAVRSFFTAVLGKAGMINIKNYSESQVAKRKDLVPTLEELKKMLDVSNLEEKFRIIFIAQTGMRVSDALKLKVGDIQRELELGRIPLAITFVPKKDSELIGERITFLASDGIEILKQYLEWRKQNGENITPESPLFVSRTNRGLKPITPHRFNDTIKRAAKKAGLNGNWKYGIMGVHCLRKFFITQLTNHGMEDKIVNFFVCHKISDIDRVYWFRRVEELRRIYAQRQQYLNPINGKKLVFDLKQMEGIIAKIKDMDARIDNLIKTDDLKKIIREVVSQELKNQLMSKQYESKVVSSEEEVVELSNLGYECQPLGNGKWLMRRKIT